MAVLARRLWIPWPWRLSLPIALLPAASIIPLALLIRLTGGWTSPMGLVIALPVAFVTLIGSRRNAIATAVLAALATASPAVYDPRGNSLAVLLIAIATYCTLVIGLGRTRRRVRAGEQTERRAKGLVTLQRVAAIVVGHLSMDDAFKAIVDELGVAFGHQLISVYLRDGENLVMRAQAGYVHPYEVIPVGVGVIGRVAEHGETTFVPDVSRDPYYRPAVDGVVSELCVPLYDGDSVAGILNVESRTPLTALDAELMELLAVPVSSVLRNARYAADLRVRAERDPVTDLFNHRTLMEELDSLLAVPGARCAVLMMDLDDFKLFNDTYGHLTGDAVLRKVATIMRENCRGDDLAARYGGDEFVVILPAASAHTAEMIRTRIRQAVRSERYVAPDGREISLGISCGIAVAPRDGESRQTLLAAADAAMYEDKSPVRRTRDAG